MNHKALFLVSLLVIVVGIGGLVFHQGNQSAPLAPAVRSATGEKSILVAKTVRPVSAGSLLTTDDFSVQTLSVPETSDLLAYDITAQGSLEGYLVTVALAENSYIAPQVVESPGSPTFLRNSLHAGEVAWQFRVDTRHGWLLDSLKPGDEATLYLRTLETNKNSKVKESVALNSDEMSGGQSQRYVLTAVINRMQVRGVKRLSEAQQDENAKAKKKEESDYVGDITLRVSNQDLRKIKVIEKAGDVLLLPGAGDDSGQLQLDHLLPNLPKFTELRG